MLAANLCHYIAPKILGGNHLYFIARRQRLLFSLQQCDGRNNGNQRYGKNKYDAAAVRRAFGFV